MSYKNPQKPNEGTESRVPHSTGTVWRLLQGLGELWLIEVFGLWEISRRASC